MSGSKTINHEGVVRQIGDGFVTVAITSVSACSGCHAEGSCPVSGTKEKIIDIKGSYNLKEGDHVTVQMAKSMGYTALVLVYLVPLAILITALATFLALEFKEVQAGIISLLSIFVYYISLLLCKKKINNKFAFSLKT